MQLNSLIEFDSACRVQSRRSTSVQIGRRLKADYFDGTTYVLVAALPTSGNPREWIRPIRCGRDGGSRRRSVVPAKPRLISQP